MAGISDVKAQKMYDALMSSARKKGIAGGRRDRYTYGAMRAAGWRPDREGKKRKGGKS